MLPSTWLLEITQKPEASVQSRVVERMLHPLHSFFSVEVNPDGYFWNLKVETWNQARCPFLCSREQFYPISSRCRLDETYEKVRNRGGSNIVSLRDKMVANKLNQGKHFIWWSLIYVLLKYTLNQSYFWICHHQITEHFALILDPAEFIVSNSLIKGPVRLQMDRIDPWPNPFRTNPTHFLDPWIRVGF